MAMDIGTNSIKIFSVSPGKGDESYHLDEMLLEELPHGLVCGGFTNPTVSDLALFRSIVSKLLSGIKSKKAGMWIGLPDRWVKLHLLSLQLKPNEVGSADYINWRLGKLLPIPESMAVLIDHQILDAEETEFGTNYRILAGALSRNIIDLLSNIFADLAVEVMGYDTSTLGVYNLIEESFTDKPPDSQVILCHIGHETTVVKVFHNSVIAYERVIEVGGEELGRLFGDVASIPADEAHIAKTKTRFFPTDMPQLLDLIENGSMIDKVFGNWLRELNVTFRFYQDKFKILRLPRIYLTGGSSLFPGLHEFLSDYFDTACRLFNPMEIIHFTDCPAADSSLLGPRFAPCIGLLSCREDS